MNTIEKVLAGVVLCSALGLIALGHIVAGFFLAVCVTLALGWYVNNPPSAASQAFVIPGEGWFISRKEQNVPVLCSACNMDNVLRFMAGRGLEVELKQEQETLFGHDLSVYGRWTDRSGCQQHKKLGLIPAEEARGLYSETQSRPGCLVSAKVSEVFVPNRQKGFPGLALDIAVLEPLHDHKKARRCTG